MELFGGMGGFALLTILIAFAPLLMAIVYFVRPTDHNLALMRPVSLSGIFGALCGVIGGIISILRGIGVAASPIADIYPKVAVGFAEALVPVFVCFGCLTIAWLLVALAMRRAA